MQKNPIIVIGEKESQDFYPTLFSSDERIEVHFYKKQADFSQWNEADMILLDCGFSPEIGLALLKAIKSSRPHVPVVFLTSVSSDSVAMNATLPKKAKNNKCGSFLKEYVGKGALSG